MTTQTRNTARIATLNDRARTAMGVASRVVQTPGIAALDPQVQSRIREGVETFTAFTPSNDPYGERDFGAFSVVTKPESARGERESIRVFWKIDYYDPTFTYGSEDPSDPGQTRRVVTIMLAEEYQRRRPACVYTSS